MLRQKNKQPFEKRKKSLSDSESLPVVQQQTHIRPILWSKPIRDSEGRTPPLIGRGPDIPVCVCKLRLKMHLLLQSDREVSSRDVCSGANLATLSFQTTLATFFPKKATSDKSSDFLDKL